MRVQVKQEHIDAAEALDESENNLTWCATCPIAVALACMGFADSLVGEDRVELDAGCNSQLPPSARRFIEDYDNGEPVNPFTFNLEIDRG